MGEENTTPESSVVDPAECRFYNNGMGEWRMVSSCTRDFYEQACLDTDRSTSYASTAPTTPARSVSDPGEHYRHLPTVQSLTYERRGLLYKAPKASILDITVGVELELILLTQTPTPPTTLYPLLRTSLSPLAARLSTTVPDLQAAPHPHPETVFQVKTDDTITCSPWVNGVPIEIATPILRGREWEWVLPAVCAAVKKLPGVAVRVNKSTGLHVHVGLGRPYTLVELKRVAKAVLLLEGCMDGNHPRHRIPVEAMGSCYRSVVGNMVFRGCGGRKWEMVEMVDGCESVEELLGVVNATAGRGSGCCRLYKYNFTAVVGYGSVEFRQAAGTACGGRVVEWVRCVAAFVTRAVETREEEWEEWAKRGEVPRELWRFFGAPSASGWGRRSREGRKVKRKNRRVPMKFRLSRRKKNAYLTRQGRF